VPRAGVVERISDVAKVVRLGTLAEKTNFWLGGVCHRAGVIQRGRGYVCGGETPPQTADEGTGTKGCRVAGDHGELVE
jgi:hypothetical protein